jgi:ribosomal protein S18 acetylase RimI-like enzyme
MLIREYRKEDFKRVCEINKECHGEWASPDLPLLVALKEGKTWVVTEGTEIIGFLLSTLRHWRTSNKTLPYVFNVSVLPVYQRRGIATALLKHFEKYYKSFSQFGLYVRTDNPARSLYLKLGYKIVEVLDQFYGKDKHGFFMVKQSL